MTNEASREIAGYGWQPEETEKTEQHARAHARFGKERQTLQLVAKETISILSSDHTSSFTYRQNVCQTGEN